MQQRGGKPEDHGQKQRHGLHSMTQRIGEIGADTQRHHDYDASAVTFDHLGGGQASRGRISVINLHRMTHGQLLHRNAGPTCGAAWVMKKHSRSLIGTSEVPQTAE
jgi:hypothetical protein